MLLPLRTRSGELVHGHFLAPASLVTQVVTNAGIFGDAELGHASISVVDGDRVALAGYAALL